MKSLSYLLVMLALGLPIAQLIGAAKPTVPVDPVTAILDAFQSHSIVALGEPHGIEQAASFRAALVRDSRFVNTVNDIVIESGNSRYQAVVDRFVTGQAVPDATLREVWQNTTVANFVWERPIYERFYRAVRDANASLPRQKQLRLLLGDPPVDWTAVHTGSDLQKWLLQRDSSATSIIRDQVLAKHRRALVIYGEAHLWRHNAGNNLVSRLERDGTKVFVISTPAFTDLASVQPTVSGWPTPSVALLPGTVIGAQNFQRLFGFPGTDSIRFEDQVDALLYLGSPSRMTTSFLPAALCADEQYVSMRLARMALDAGPLGSPPPAEQLRANCATN